MKSIMGYRKFLLGIVGLTILVVTNIVILGLLLGNVVSSDRFIDFAIESAKVVGIIVGAFMATNVGTHIIHAIKERKNGKDHK